MSILRFITGTPKTLEEMYNYITDPAKTDKDFIFGIGINPFDMVNQMLFVHHAYRRYPYHPYKQIVFSFDKNINLSMEKIKDVCIKIGYKLISDRRHLVGAIHYKNEDNIHCHYILNYVSADGEMYEQYGGIYSYRQKINPILKRNRLNPIGHLEEWIDYD